MRRRPRRRSASYRRPLPVIPFTSRREGWKVRPARYLRTQYDQSVILATFTYQEQFNYVSADTVKQYVFNGNDAYDPWVGVGNDSALNLDKAALFFNKGYCYKSSISVGLQTLSAANGFDLLIVPNQISITLPTDLVETYNYYRSTPGVKLWTCTGGDKVNLLGFGKMTTKKMYPEFDTRHDANFQHVIISASPATTWKWNVILGKTYGASNIPAMNIKVKIVYHYVLFNQIPNDAVPS